MIREVVLCNAKDLDPRLFTDGREYIEIVRRQALIAGGICVVADDGRLSWVNAERFEYRRAGGAT